MTDILVIDYQSQRVLVTEVDTIRLCKREYLAQQHAQHPTTFKKVCKRTQHVTANNVGSCWPTKLLPRLPGK